MRVLTSYREVPEALRGGAIAIGNFDGVHRGHQAVLALTREWAGKAGGPAGALLFDPHPRELFEPDKPLFRLTPLPYRLRLLGALGLDLALTLTFDRALAGMSAEDFVGEVLVGGLGVRHVIVGYDFSFGRGRAGNPALLATMGERLGFAATALPAVNSAGGTAFSSSRIRQLLREGDVGEAARHLGHWWRVIGPVVSGAGRGAGLGFPTANLALPPGFALKHGIYAARVHSAQGCHKGAAYFGTRPTFDNGRPLLETFLFDFDGDLYGQEIQVEMIARLRDDQAFAGLEALKAQMAEDCRQAGRILDEVGRDNPLHAFPLARHLEKAG